MTPKSPCERLWEDRYSIFRPFAIVNDYLPAMEIHVLHPETQSFSQSQAGAVQEPREERIRDRHFQQHSLHLVPAQHFRQAGRPLGPCKVVQTAEIGSEHVLIKK